MGRPPTYTPLHRDPNPNLFIQLVGTKVIRLMKPEDGRKLYAGAKSGNGHANIRGEEMMLGGERDGLENAVWVDGNSNDNIALETTLESGDGLYIPLGWWHSVRGIKRPENGVNASVSTHCENQIKE